MRIPDELIRIQPDHRRVRSRLRADSVCGEECVGIGPSGESRVRAVVPRTAYGFNVIPVPVCRIVYAKEIPESVPGSIAGIILFWIVEELLGVGRNGLKSHHRPVIELDVSVETTRKIAVSWKYPCCAEEPDIMLTADVPLQPKNTEICILIKELSTWPEVRIGIVPLVIRKIPRRVVRSNQKTK